MAVRVKRRRRLIVVLVVMAGLGVLIGGGALYRYQTLQAEAKQSRVDGIAAFERGDFFNAMHKLGSYLHRYPEDTEVLYQYAQARLKNPKEGGGHVYETIGVLRRLVELQPDHPTAPSELLDLYQVARLHTEAVAMAEQILEEDPNNSSAVEAKIATLIEKREYDQALGFADELLAMPPSGVSSYSPEILGHALRAKLHVLMARAKYEEALVYARRYNEISPEDIEGQFRTIQLMHQLGSEPDEYLALARALRKQHEDEPRYKLLEAMAVRLSGDRAEAIRLLRDVGGEALTDQWVIRRLVEEMDGLGLYDDGTEVLSATMGQVESLWLERVLAHRLIQSGLQKKVLEFLGSAIEDTQAPDADSELLGLYAMVLIEVGRHPEASMILETLGKRTHDSTAESWLLFLRDVKAQPDTPTSEVIDICKKAIAATERNPYTNYVLGQAYAGIGEIELALNSWGQASQYGPAWAAPRMQIAKALIGTERRALAVFQAEAAFRRAPRNPEVAITLAMAVAANIDMLPDDRLEHLLSLVERIQKVLPDDRRTRQVEILVLAKSGQKQMARDAMMELLEEQEPPLTEIELMRMADLSRRMGLGLEELCAVKIKKYHGLTPTAALNQALKLLATGRPDEGAAVFDKALEQERVGDDASWNLALARFMDAKQDPSALERWAKLGDSYPTHVTIQKAILSSRTGWKDLDLIEQTISRLRESTREEAISWRVAQARWLIASSSGDQRELIKASDLLVEIVAEAPALYQPRLLLAECYQRMENYTGAAEQLSLSIQLRPEDNDIKMALAQVLQSQGNFDRVRSVIKEVIESDSKNLVDVERSADILVRQGDVDRALVLLEQIYDPVSQPRNSDLLLARIYRQKNRIEDTERIIEKLLMTPSAVAIRFAAEFYAGLGRTEDAEQTLLLLDDIALAPGIKSTIRAEHYARFGKIDLAVEQFESAVSSAPENSAIWKELIRLRIGKGQADEAIDTAKRALDSLGHEAAIESFLDQESLVVASLQDPRRVELVKSLLSAESRRGIAVEALRLVDGTFESQEQITDRINELKRLADANTKFLQLQTYLAQELTRLGRFNDAIMVGTRAMEAFPTDPSSARLSAAALSMAGRWDEVIGVASQWRDRSGGQTLRPDMMIAEAHLRLGNPEAALQRINPHLRGRTLEGNRYDPVIAIYTRALMLSGQTDQAQQMLSPVLSGSRQWREVWIQLAVTTLRDPVQIEDWLGQVTLLIPVDSVDEWMLLARSWLAVAERDGMNNGYLKQAGVVVDQLTSGASDRAEVWLLHGIVKYQEGDLQTAESSYRKALEISPQMHSAMNNLAMTLADRGSDLDNALTLALDAVKSQPGVPAYLDTLASVYTARGEYESAVEPLEKAVSLDPRNTIWQRSLAAVLRELGRDDEAALLNTGAAP